MFKNFLDNNLFVYIDKLLNKSNVINGLIEETKKLKAKRGDYGIATIDLSGSRTIKEDGDFEAFVPVGEQQNKTLLDGTDPMWCVSENGLCNQIETVINYFISLGDKADNETKQIVKVFKAFDLIKNNKCLLDTAYVAVGSGTTRRGNSYQKVADFIRKYGLIPKGTFPNYGNWKSWNDLYYSGDTYVNGNKVNNSLLEQGKRILEYIDFSYCWYPEDSKKANELGCPGTSIGAWSYPSNDGIYRDTGIPINHAITRVKKIDKYRTVGDSYTPFIKKTSLNYPVGSDFLLSVRLKKEINQFNEIEIAKQRNKGRQFLLLVGDYKNYTPGVYELKDNKLNKIELPQAVDNWIKEQARIGKLIGISPEDFKKFVNY